MFGHTYSTLGQARDFPCVHPWSWLLWGRDERGRGEFIGFCCGVCGRMH